VSPPEGEKDGDRGQEQQRDDQARPQSKQCPVCRCSRNSHEWAQEAARGERNWDRRAHLSSKSILRAGSDVRRTFLAKPRLDAGSGFWQEPAGWKERMTFVGGGVRLVEREEIGHDVLIPGPLPNPDVSFLQGGPPAATPAEACDFSKSVVNIMPGPR